MTPKPVHEMTAPELLAEANRFTAPKRATVASGGSIHLVIPGVAPSKGNSYRIGRRRDGTATLVKGSPGRAGNAVAAFELSALAVMLEQRVQPLTGPVSVEAIVYPPDRRADVPGIEKALCDALQNWRKRGRRRVTNPGGYGCYLNDAQVERFLVELGSVDAAHPRIDVTVSPRAARTITPIMASL